jgi:hypothetical protein
MKWSQNLYKIVFEFNFKSKFNSNQRLALGSKIIFS